MKATSVSSSDGVNCRNFRQRRSSRIRNAGDGFVTFLNLRKSCSEGKFPAFRKARKAGSFLAISYRDARSTVELVPDWDSSFDSLVESTCTVCSSCWS
jgi:hypothetical protein